MTQRARAILKGYFETEDIPTQEQFSDLIDSLLNIVDDETPAQVMAAHVSGEDPHTQYIREVEKGVANGVPTLDGDGKVPDNQIPNSITRDSELAEHASDSTDPHGATLEQTNMKVGQAFFSGEVDNSNSGAAKTINWTAGNKQKITLTGACAFTFTAPTGPCNLVLRVIANGTAYTPTWPNTVKWPGGTAPTLTSTNAKWDVLAFYYDGTNYSAVASQNFG